MRRCGQPRRVTTPRSTLQLILATQSGASVGMIACPRSPRPLAANHMRVRRTAREPRHCNRAESLILQPFEPRFGARRIRRWPHGLRGDARRSLHGLRGDQLHIIGVDDDLRRSSGRRSPHVPAGITRGPRPIPPRGRVRKARRLDFRAFSGKTAGTVTGDGREQGRPSTQREVGQPKAGLGA